ncbi:MULTISPECIES: type I secretion system permease/ATPase [Bradyrhizobium]|uniref:type I secretion system permease/ATPase n=1 Tax=Bradyrhizobium TaxID=374 RepID=UPI001B89F2BB|nr:MULTISPECIES: type I secretion system permease/ATPase [Bradyrhizobium]MBR0975126.1 type I secretion system permease/ATPase [Bradyrhizobium japonicum]
MAKSKELTAAKRRRLRELTQGLRGVALFLFMVSGMINVLALTGSVYMMQIYDRALTSGSVPTLLVLSTLAIGLYLFQGCFDVVRSQVLVRVGARIDRKIAPLAHRVAIDMPRFGFSTSEALERGRDVDTVRGFLGSQGPSALFDLPWMPIYLTFIYVLHPMLGALTVAGALVLVVLTVVSEIMTKRLAVNLRKSAIARNGIADCNARNAEVLKAMGFAGRAVGRFNEANGEHLELQTRANDITGSFAAVSRVLRMVLQSALLGLGAYLTIKGELSAGTIIAVSVASARALAPVDLAIGNWKSFIAARMAYHRLRDTVVALAAADEPMQLPEPTERLSVDKITVAVPGSGQVVLSEVGFELEAGQALGIIGPSAGGKTTLVRALTGIWPVLRGSVRLDGADLSQWREDEIGKHIGYLPQEIALMDATIQDNICRLEPDPDYRKVIEAAKAAGVHDMIVRMPDGYRTRLGPQGCALSAGQRQRVALARALYGNPFIVVMDEPNSNLDGEGEAALTAAIESIRARGGIAIVIAHRPSALVAVDLVAIVQAGRMVAFGKKQDIMTPVLQPTAATETRETESQMRRPA